MSENRTGRLAFVRKRLLAVVVALVAPTAMLGLASPALATEHHPTGEFAPYADCPLSNPSVEICTLAETTSGEFTVGLRTVPIVNTITLQGGLYENTETRELEFVAAEDGETLSKTKETVPGGLFNSTPPEEWPQWAKEWYEEMINKGLTGVTETTELAGPASAIKLNLGNLISQEGVALKLPVKVKLENWLLGNECYVGSSSNPIVLNLTTGKTEPPEPNESIEGNPGELEFLAEGSIISLSGGSLVDNAFAAGGAHGCGGIFSFLVDPLVNELMGVPSAAGHNTAILNGSLSAAAAFAVLASEE